MKKVLTLAAMLFAATITISSCSSTKSTGTATSASHGQISGTWTVSSINYEGLVENNVQTIFDLAAPSAFQNSTWTLTGSGNGSIALNNGTVQPIYWSMYNAQSPAMFQFKKVNAGEKAKNIDAGYRMDVSAANSSSLVLRSPVQTGGTTAYIIFNLVKK